MGKELSILYVGSAIPDTRETHAIQGLSLAGHYAELGIVEGLYKSGSEIEVVSYRPYTYYPREKVLFKKGGRSRLIGGLDCHLMPLINIYPLRNFVRNIYLFFYIVNWTFRKRNKCRIVIVFNWLFPNFIFLRTLTTILKSKLCPVLMDWLPMDCNRLSIMQSLTYPMWFRKLSVKSLSLADAVFPITEHIPEDNFPNMPYLLVDGGVSQLILSKLFSLDRVNNNEKFTIFFAGGISVINHIDVLVSYMKNNQSSDIEMWFAGKGDALQLVLDAQQLDARIKYLGMLPADKLFEYYNKADVLVSLRDVDDPRLRYYYPSKTLELLCVGKPFITTNTAHTKREYGEYCKVLDDCSVDSFAQAVEFFRNMPVNERVIYGKRAREYMLKEHTWIKQGKRMSDFIKREFAK